MRPGAAWVTAENPMRHSFLSVLGLALIVRVAWALAVPVQPVSDSHVYDLLARHLADGLGFCFLPGQPTALWPVGTSFLYSLFYRLFGVSYVPIVVFNLFLSLVSLWLLMLLAERWFGRHLALVAGYLTALWPVQIEFTTVLASELIFNFLMLALLFLWESSRINPWLKAVLVGLLSAAAVYIRPVAFFFPLLLCIPGVFRSRRIFQPIGSMLLAFAILAAAIAPWSLRNLHTLGRLVPMSTNGGEDIWMGNNPTGPGKAQYLPPNALAMPEAARDIYLANLGKAYIRRHPGRFLVRSLHKTVWLYDHETIGVHWNPAIQSRYGSRVFWLLKLASDLYWWAALALACGGLVLLLIRRGFGLFLTFPPLVFLLYFTALYSAILATDRYHYGCLPFLAMFAAYTLCAMRKRAAEPVPQPAAH